MKPLSRQILAQTAIRMKELQQSYSGNNIVRECLHYSSGVLRMRVISGSREVGRPQIEQLSLQLKSRDKLEMHWMVELVLEYS